MKNRSGDYKEDKDVGMNKKTSVAVLMSPLPPSPSSLPAGCCTAKNITYII